MADVHLRKIRWMRYGAAECSNRQFVPQFRQARVSGVIPERLRRFQGTLRLILDLDGVPYRSNSSRTACPKIAISVAKETALRR